MWNQRWRPPAPTPLPEGTVLLEEKQVACGVTAVARRVPRLAGLMRIPCQLNRKDRRRATGPPARNKDQRGFGINVGFLAGA